MLQILFDALSLGSLYALGALGIALIFGVMRLVNFAHGDVIAFCVFALLWPSTDAMAIVFAGQLPWYLLVPFVLLCGAGLSVLCEIVVFRRFRKANPATAKDEVKNEHKEAAVPSCLRLGGSLANEICECGSGCVDLDEPRTRRTP